MSESRTVSCAPTTGRRAAVWAMAAWVVAVAFPVRASSADVGVGGDGRGGTDAGESPRADAAAGSSPEAGAGPSPDVGVASQTPADRASEPDVGIGTARPRRTDAGAPAVGTGPVIADVELTCDLPRCGDPVESEKLLDLAGLYPGQEFAPATRTAAKERLLKTGLFDRVAFRTEPAGSGQIELQVEAVGARRVRSIAFEGVDPPPFRSDLRKLLIYREGESFQDDLSKKNTQLASLEAEFREEGFFGTEIELVVEPVPGREKLVDLTFDVDKGRRLYVCSIGVRGLDALSYTEARRALLSEVSIFARRLEIVRPPFTTETFKKGQEALLQRYRERGYFRVRITETAVQKSFSKGCVTLLVDVDEGPRWDVEFEGNTVFEVDRLERELPFYESGYVDEQEITRAERALRQLYETRGYPFAEIEGREFRDDRLHRRLVFEIEEGPRLEIGNVHFHGNDVFTGAKLRENMGTKRYELFAPGGFLQTEQLLGDFRRIEQMYRNRGYLEAVVDRFTLEVRPDEEDLVVHVHIREGEQTRTSDVEFAGLRSVTRARAEDRVKVQEGDPFVGVQVRADQSRMTQLYSSIGYPLAVVETECRTPGGETIPCERPKLAANCVADSVKALEPNCEWRETRRGREWVCQRVDPECSHEGGIGARRRVRVVHRIDEGPLITTGSFLLQGNFRTRDHVVFREIPLESDEIFDVREILAGQSNLRSLGIFDSVSIEAIGLDELAARSDENRASLLVSVEEARNRFFQFKFGLEGRDLLNERRRLLTTGEVQYTDRNLLGSALQLEPNVFAAADVLQLGREGSAAVEQRTIAPGGRVDYLVGAELPFRDPRFLKGALGVDKLHLTVTPFYLVDLLGVMNDQLLREEWGVAAEVRKHLSELLDRFFVSLGVEAKQTATAPVGGPVVDGERVFSPRRITGKLIPKVTLDRRDSPLNPSRGFYARIQPELVSGDALSPEVDTVDDSYLRLTWKFDGFIPLWKNTVLAQSVRAGQAVPLFGRETRIPADERYFLGGAGSVRGYPNNSLGPVLSGQPAGGEFLLNYNFELRYPLISNTNLRGATFFDAGLLVDCFSDRDLTRRTGCYRDAFDAEFRQNLRTAAGVGLRYIIADQIPLLFDYGIALDRRGSEQIGNLHFHLGYTF